MFFYLSKIITLLINPLFILIFLLCLISTRTSLSKRYSLLLRVLAGGIFLFTNPWLSNMAMSKLEATHKPLTEHSYSSGIVLGGYSYYMDQHSKIVFTSGADRLLQALKLLQTGKIRRIFLSGGSGFIFDRQQSEATYVSDFLHTCGVKKEQLIIESQSRNTHENALNAKRTLSEYNLNHQKHLLITSAFHIKRASQCFKKQQINFDVYACDFRAKPINGFFPKIIPSVDVLIDWKIIFHEIIGLIAYKTLGYC